MFGWTNKERTKIYRDGTVVSLVPLDDDGRVSVQIRLDLPPQVDDIQWQDGVPIFDRELTAGPKPLQVGDRVRIMEMRIENNMRIVATGLERLP